MAQLPKEIKTCKMCRFWGKLPDALPYKGSIGLCRKSHPAEIGTGNRPYNGGQWPSTMADDWCGEFELNVVQEEN